MAVAITYLLEKTTHEEVALRYFLCLCKESDKESTADFECGGRFLLNISSGKIGT